MKIESIQLKHTLHFTDIKLNFNYHDLPITLILGDQGSGKTSLLRFSYQALTWFAARYKDLRTAGVVMLDQDIMLTRLQSKLDIQVQLSRRNWLIFSPQVTNETNRPTMSVHGNCTKP